MEVKKTSVSEGTKITVETEEKVALAVYDEEGERIYLPDSSGSDTTYYSGEVEGLEKKSSGFTIVHPREIESFEVLS